MTIPDEVTSDDDPSVNGYGEEYYDWLEEEHDRQCEECARQIVACFEGVTRELGQDEAWALFAEFVKLSKPPAKRGRPSGGRNNPDRDAALLKADSEAPSGKKQASVIAAGREHKSEPIAGLETAHPPAQRRTGPRGDAGCLASVRQIEN